MQAMLVEIEQHQPAWKQATKQNFPTERRRKQLVAVEQNKLVGFRAEQRNVALSERMIAKNRAVALGPPLDETLRIGEQNQGVADERPAIIAGNMRKHARGSRLAVKSR